MLGVTTYISTDVASFPLLWVLPLAVYLLTFVVAFSRRPLVTSRAAARILPLPTALVFAQMLGAVSSTAAGHAAHAAGRALPRRAPWRTGVWRRNAPRPNG